MIASPPRSTRPSATIWIPSAARFARTPFATVKPSPSLSPSLPAESAASSSLSSSLSASLAASSKPSPSTSSATFPNFRNAEATSFTASSRVSALRETFFNALSSSSASPFTSMMIEPSAIKALLSRVILGSQALPDHRIIKSPSHSFSRWKGLKGSRIKFHKTSGFFYAWISTRLSNPSSSSVGILPNRRTQSAAVACSWIRVVLRMSSGVCPGRCLRS